VSPVIGGEDLAQSGQVGWSFGGVIAREAARLDPSAVRRVVTLGTPVVGGPKYTRVARWLHRSGHDVDAIERAVEELNRTPLTVPVRAVYSKTDGVVDWRACIDPWTPTVEHVEVRSSHLGMGHHPAVLEVVARRLAMAAAPA
jgi:pimeloyl-ACP methyl ester carboxylesterase